MHFTAWTTLAALGVYCWTISAAGRARVQYKVEAPSMDGPPEFQRAVRVQANTLEQLPIILVLMWMCATYLGDPWGAAGGLIWCVGRVVYALAYYKFPPSRVTGFMIGLAGIASLGIGTVVGLLLH